MVYIKKPKKVIERSGTLLILARKPGFDNNPDLAVCRCEACGTERTYGYYYVASGKARCIVCKCRKQAKENPKLKEAARLREERLSYRDIGEQLGISYERVRQLLGRVDLAYDIGLNREDFRRFDEAKIRAAAESGRSFLKTIKELKTSFITLQKYCKEKGIKFLNNRQKRLKLDVGRRNEMLEVVGIVKRQTNQHRMNFFICKCDCGGRTEVRPGNFKRTKSCGCLRDEYYNNRAGHHLRKQKEVILGV